MVLNIRLTTLELTRSYRRRAEGKDGGTAGPLAYFDVQDGTPALPAVELDAQIAQANLGIEVQDIEPTTVESEYDSSQVPVLISFLTSGTPLRKESLTGQKLFLLVLKMSKMLRLKQSFRNTKRRILAKRLIVIDSYPFPSNLAVGTKLLLRTGWVMKIHF